MHYRNGRDAKNGDDVVQINEKGVITAAGTLVKATPGNDYCNGWIVAGLPSAPTSIGACLCDCLHVDDVAVLLTEKGWEKRPPGK